MANKQKILIVDDETKVCEIMGRFLQKNGFETVAVHNGLEAIEHCASFNPDVVLLDIRMPKMNGIEALKHIKKDHPNIEVILTTAVGETEIAVSCMKEGAFGYLMKPLDLESLILEIKKALEHGRLVLENKDYQINLEKKVKERTKKVHLLNKNLKKSFIETVKISWSLVEVFDPSLGEHSKRVMQLAKKIGSTLMIPNKKFFDLELAGLLHEIGMVAVPDHMKNKPFSELREKEKEIIKKTPLFSQKILSPSKELNKAGLIIRHHLEHIDGTGFPDSLKGEEIPLESRILGLANAFDEMVYRRMFTKKIFPNKKLKIEFVCDRLQKLAGKYYDKKITELLREVVGSFSKGPGYRAVCSAYELIPGMITAVDIRTKDGRLLLGEGNTISHTQIFKIQILDSERLLGNELYVYENI